ncbi:MAG: hypothetical protein ACI4ES_11625, partial [Roseburia sp.]
YMGRISNLPVALILALVCAVLPINGTIIMAALVVLLDFYALSVEVCLVALAVFVLVYFLYFRFAPKNGYSAILTPICFKWNIPYVMPIGVGLLREAYSVSALVFGTIIYYFVDGVRMNAVLLSETADESQTSTSKFVIALNQLFGNKEMYLALGIIVVGTLIVYLIRRMSIDHAWPIAIVAGVLFEIVGFFVGYLMLGVTGKTLWLILGNIISLGIAFVIQFFCFDLDYSRTENLQFEDDEYYYYVKAVPKVYVSSSDKKVKHFGQKEKEEQERLNKKCLAEEMEIDEDLFD